MKQDQVFFLELDENCRLKGNVCQIKGGVIMEVAGDFLLSEAFCPHTNGFVLANNIKLATVAGVQASTADSPRVAAPSISEIHSDGLS